MAKAVTQRNPVSKTKTKTKTKTNKNQNQNKPTNQTRKRGLEVVFTLIRKEESSDVNQ
ncbi:hypothetical protein I79_012681 [Cricetulus griseus]|uniref:Uncharacterized protein n=1 Tax=Cricetulus griseus TaxID=10029 RepID=G3HPG9_CRIGR|nr:hypothetical protein I79_012681 [Cricetulus griseus]